MNTIIAVGDVSGTLTLVDFSGTILGKKTSAHT